MLSLENSLLKGVNEGTAYSTGKPLSKFKRSVEETLRGNASRVLMPDAHVSA